MKEIILLKETTAESVKRDCVAVLLFMMPIGLGVYLESDAMQWVGFVFGVFFTFARASRIAKDNRMTIEEARKRLDELERTP